MKNIFTFVALTVFVLGFASVTQATGVTGQFINTGTIADPFVPADIYDIWEFELTSDIGDVSTLDFTNATGSGFSTAGTFAQGGGAAFRDNTAMPVLGPFTVPETFFVTNPAPPVVSGNLIDDATTLEAFFSNGLTPLAADNVPTVVAVFSILQGSVAPGTAPTFVGGNADVGGVLIPITLGGTTPTNQPPVANIVGPLFVDTDINPAVTLDASGSTDDGNIAALTYAWDLDDNGSYEVSSGTNPLLPIADVNVDIGFNGIYNIGVQVFDGEFFSTASTTLEIVPEPGSIALAGMGLIGLLATRRRRNA
ncbi:MAG: PEP-CTERM sorting domain-containing protein [Planctomycetes bacterium]|nr:PEP-CTERM sorting domain-containing protein [Planctomycetota bacterium]